MSYSKNCICKFMQANSWHHKLFQFHLSFWVWKVWKGREKIQKCEYRKNEKSFLDEIKNMNIFHSFWRAIIWWKNKNWIKNSGHKLKVGVGVHLKKKGSSLRQPLKSEFLFWINFNWNGWETTCINILQFLFQIFSLFKHISNILGTCKLRYNLCNWKLI